MCAPGAHGARRARSPAGAPDAAGPSEPAAPVGRTGPVGLRNTTVPPEAGGLAVPESPSDSESDAWNVAVPSVWSDRPSGWDGWDWWADSAGSADSEGTRGSGLPQRTRRSGSPPKPVCRERSAPQAVAGSGLLPCWASARDGLAAGGSSSKKCGPVSSVEAGGSSVGDESGPPSDGAGRLVPGTQAAPFQYRTYPGMEGSG